jgi:bacterial/archaeal transporter family protein
MWILYALLSAIFAALVAIFGKIGIAKIDTTLATTVRAIIMAVFLVLTSLAVGKFSQWSTISNKALLYIALSGVAGALSWLCYFMALRNGPTSAVAAIDRTSVIFVVLLAAMLLQEKITFNAGMGAALIAVGAMLLVLR